MATPSAARQGKTPSQSQHGAAATPQVSTPFSASHVAFSPHGPRSSPQQIKKSPANSATLMGHPSNAPVNFDSPSAAAALGALGINGSLDLGLDNVGVAGLGGMGALRRGDDDERTKRLQDILGILQRNKGLVSEAGLERLAKATGLECIWDTGIGADKTRTLIIAGSALSLDIVMSNNIVNNVTLSFPESNEIVMKHVEKAGRIFDNDLKLRPHESPLTKNLDGFAANLQRLAVLDNLSVLPLLNLHEAIAGLLESLDRLYQWDLQQLRDDPAMGGKAEDDLETVVMCTRHGRPAMHARNRLGLSLDYWKLRRLTRPSHGITRAYEDIYGQTWAILIGCEALGARVFQPVRVSNDWLSSDVRKVNPTDDDLLSAGTGPILDWQEPQNIVLDTPDAAKPDQAADALQQTLAGGKLPEVVFKATFDPPITVPFSVWHQLYQLTGLAPEPEYNLTTFDSLSFPLPPGSNHDPSEPRTVTCRQDVYYRSKDGQASTIPHANTLYIYKPVYGRTVEELPFGHPSQLVRMLPTLRQYAFLSTLLLNSFNAKMEDIVASPKDKAGSTVVDARTVKDDFADFMGQPDDDDDDDGDGNETTEQPRAQTQEPRSGSAINMDVILTAHPVPRLQVTFPLNETTAEIMLEIRLNGLVHVVSQNLIPEEEEEDAVMDDGDKKPKQTRRPQDLGRVLEVCEDLGQWCEWIRSRCQ